MTTIAAVVASSGDGGVLAVMAARISVTASATRSSKSPSTACYGAASARANSATICSRDWAMTSPASTAAAVACESV